MDKLADNHRQTSVRNVEALAWIGILALAAFLRFYDLGRFQLWLDESCTSYVVFHLASWPTEGPPWAEVAHLPYFGLLRGWTYLFGESGCALRSLSATAGVLGVLAVGMLARRAGGRTAGLIALILAAVNPLQIHYSREARVYALWILALTICLLLLRRAAESGRWRYWLAYGLAAWVAVLLHYYTLLWIPATAAVLLVGSNRRRTARRWIVTHAVLGFALVPVLIGLVIPNAETGPRRWLQQVWEGYPPWAAMARSISVMLPAGWYPNYLGEVGAADDWLAATWGAMPAGIVVWAPLIAFVALVVWGLLRIRTNRSRAVEAFWLLAGTLAFLVLAWLASLLWRPAYVVGRYDLAAWPMLIGGMAILIAQTGRRSGRVAGRVVLPAVITSVLTVCSAVTIYAAASVVPQRDTQERVRRIAAEVSPGDLIISVGLYRWFLDHAWRRQGVDVEWLSFPRRHDRQLCWDDAEAELQHPGEIEADVAFTLGRIRDALENGRHVWLLAQGEPETPRWEVDRHLFEALHGADIEIALRDAWLGLAELRPIP
ncbi:MAG: glycosyltransferase family 39 protein [Phycisphaerae bacterium]|nr:glycosyltransferase family 39 protein [Phycisphaerae bacterium]